MPRASFVVFLMVCWSHDVLADQWWPALGWNCDEKAGHFAAYPIYFDANKQMPTTREGFFVPMEKGWDNPKKEVPVLKCELGKAQRIEVIRIGLKVPSPRGMCGAGAYSDYSLRYNGEERAQFAIGCSASTFVSISENSGEICNTAQSNDPCRPLNEGSITILNAFGQFGERPQ